MPRLRIFALWFAGALPALLAPAADAQQSTFTPRHVANTRLVTAAVISPDGSRVAYVLSVPRKLAKEKDGPSWAELHVVDAKGSDTPFITGAVNVDALAWTPDGKGISFLAKRGTDTQRSLYVIPARGGEARKVLAHPTDVLSYSWGSDGKQIAYLATEPTPKERKTRQDQGFTQEVYEENNPPVRVWVANADGASKARMLKLEGSASELHWQPRGDRLAVALAPTPLIDAYLMFRKVHLVDLKSGATINLKNPGKMGQAAWSPDGKLLALISGEDKHDPKEGRLWVTTDAGKGWVDLLPNFKGHIDSVAWKNASTLLYQASKGVWTEIGVVHVEMGADGKLAAAAGGRTILVKTGGPILGGLSVSADGRAWACTGHSPRHPPEVFLTGPDEKEPRRLTDSNPWLRMMTFAPQEVVKHTARDGLELEGVLVRPLGAKEGQRYPLVLTVHGGPEAHIANGWVTLYHSLGQIGAANGLAVFYPNYRGSTGYGVAFSKMGQGAAAKKEFDDLVDAVDHLVKIGLVDAKKVGITGGSYGGYATAWGSTYYSDRFAAGVMFVGISDSVSKVGTTDIPWEMYLVHHRKWLWDDWDYFLKSSPIYYTDRAKTPLLILHGKNDPRVHPSQSLELHRNLKLRGKAPVRLVLYPGEGHGNRRAASRYDYSLRLLRWMTHYLKGPGGSPPPSEIDYGLTPTSAPGTGWRHAPRGAVEAVAALEALPWYGRGCPCCLWP